MLRDVNWSCCYITINSVLPVVKQSASVVTRCLSQTFVTLPRCIFNCDATFHHNAFGAQMWQIVTAEQPRCCLRDVRTIWLDVNRIGLCQPGFCLEYYSWHLSVSGLRTQTVRLTWLLIVFDCFIVCFVLTWLSLFDIKKKYMISSYWKSVG